MIFYVFLRESSPMKPPPTVAKDLVSDNAAMSAFGYGLRWPMVLLQLLD